MNRRILLYLALIPMLYIVYSISRNYSTESPFFYGFAENKETELSHDSDVYIEEILVTQGEAVREGQVLARVKRSELKYTAAENSLSESDNKLDIQGDIEKLELEISLKRSALQRFVAEVAQKISDLEEKESRRKSLLDAIESVETSTSGYSEKTQQDIARLRAEEQAKRSSTNEQIAVLEKEITRRKQNSRIATKKLKTRNSKLEEEYEKLYIRAPSNGVIGNIPTKKGENKKAYSTILSFYEENPTLVKGYVHESLILQVNKDDVLTITSSLRPENVIDGKVVGLGSRIVEIPERLRKNPAVKSYGREVLVEIPSDNNFLQKEKVSINTDAEILLAPTSRKVNERAEKRITKELNVKKK